MKLTFLPWVRQGLAAALKSTAAAARPSVTVQVQLKQDGQAARTADVAAELFGPGDVVTLDRAAIIRTYPAPGGQLTDDTLVAVELDRADLPWMFSPAAASGARLLPWLQLVVVQERSGVHFDARPGQNAVLRLNGAGIVSSELPPPEDAWAFAHAQVAGTEVTDPSTLAALVREQPAQSSSRILAARKLEKGKRYRACLVPTWEAGRRAGLGLPPAESAGLSFAWSTNAAQVELPVYFHWELECSPEGGFRELVERLTPRKLGAEVGKRTAFAAPAPELKKGFGFEVASVLEPLAAPARPAASADAQRFTAAVDALFSKKRTLTPPRYGERYGAAAQWVDRLNHDPALRVAAALGTQVVQQQQEALVAAVWKQLERPAPAMAVTAKEVNRAMLRRFFGAQEQPKASPEIVARLTAFAAKRGETAARATISAVALPSVRRLSTIAGRPSQLAKVKTVTRMARLGPRPPGISTFKSGGPAMPSPMSVSPATVDAFPTALLFRRVDDTAPFPLGLAVVNARVEVTVLRPPVVRRRGAVVRDHRTRLRQPREPFVVEGPLELPDVPRKVVRNMSGLRASVPWHLHQHQPQDNVDSGEGVELRAAVRAVQQWLAPFIKPVSVIGIFQPRRFSVAVLQPLAVKAVLAAVLSPATTAQPEPVPQPNALGIRYPMWRTLLELDPEAVLSHLEQVPMDTVGLLGVNGAFVEAFLAGLNHELLREVRWRNLPVTGAPTFFDSVFTAQPEVPPLEQWGAQANLSPRLSEATVLLLRGALIRNQPRVTLYAVREGLPETVTPPVFEGALDEATRFVGFSIPEQALKAPDQKWRFVLEEQPTEPCFLAPGVATAGPLRAAAFGAPSSAELARTSLRRPFRVVLPAMDLVP